MKYEEMWRDAEETGSIAPFLPYLDDAPDLSYFTEDKKMSIGNTLARRIVAIDRMKSSGFWGIITDLSEQSIFTLRDLFSHYDGNRTELVSFTMVDYRIGDDYILERVTFGADRRSTAYPMTLHIRHAQDLSQYIEVAVSGRYRKVGYTLEQICYWASPIEPLIHALNEHFGWSMKQEMYGVRNYFLDDRIWQRYQTFYGSPEYKEQQEAEEAELREIIPKPLLESRARHWIHHGDLNTYASRYIGCGGEIFVENKDNKSVQKIYTMTKMMGLNLCHNTCGAIFKIPVGMSDFTFYGDDGKYTLCGAQIHPSSNFESVPLPVIPFDFKFVREVEGKYEVSDWDETRYVVYSINVDLMPDGTMGIPGSYTSWRSQAREALLRLWDEATEAHELKWEDI